MTTEPQTVVAVISATIHDAAKRVADIATLEARARSLAHDIEQGEARLRAIKYGYIHEGLDGANERTREADLMHRLSIDPVYTAQVGRLDVLRIQWDDICIQLRMQRRLHALDKVALNGRSQE